MDRYELLKSWLDLRTNTLHEKVGEVLEISDEARAKELIGLKIIKKIEDKKETPIAETKKTNKKNK